MAVRVKKFRVRSNKVEYREGEIIDGLSFNDEERLIKDGFCERVNDDIGNEDDIHEDEAEEVIGNEEVDEISNLEDEDISVELMDLSKMNIEEAKNYLKIIKDVADLETLLQNETSGKNRKGIIEFIDNLLLEQHSNK